MVTVAADGTLQMLGKCVDVSYGGTGNNTLVQLWGCDGTGSQTWTYNSSTKALVNPQSGRCLDIPGSSTADGTQLQIFDCNSTNAQRWNLPS
ncbi:RICIN domain-containing protein [Streptomyces sp. NPDC049040]|uniref:RICIN domain-containing protein n=1 Tax=Streptomyces sp. NPDC049040 TaxID=3365593 RepID=UPI0037200404